MITELKSIPDIWKRTPSEMHARRFLEGVMDSVSGCLESRPQLALRRPSWTACPAERNASL